jgi:rifampicin phosphotransferase
MTEILRLNEIDPAANSLVGGKATGLARLVMAGLPVPPAFVVTTRVYEEFLDRSGVAERIPRLLAGLDHSQAEQVEERSAAVRDLILKQPIPRDLEDAIRAAYQALGAEAQVAVRSSGTAEDTAQASFAGLHDTYLNVAGTAAVAQAIRRCWASMWTARAVAYRHSARFDHMAARIAVVVQRMVEADVSGVMFTANPLNARTDEIVVNASWGLGEGLVSGILEPDEIILDARTLATRRQRIGSKEVQVVRDPAATTGTVTQPVSTERRAAISLGDAQVRALGELGQRVTAYHGGLPQDIEWAIAGGEVYLLQSRPITGVDFTWDEDVDAWQTIPEQEDTIWSGGWAAEFWSGPITPLFYSIRAREMWSRNSRTYRLLGFEDLMQLRWTKYRRGTAFYNTEVDSRLYKYLLPKALRGGALGYHPPGLREQIAAEPMDLNRFLEAMGSLYSLKPWLGVHRWEQTLRTFMHDKVDHRDFAFPAALRSWSDAQVRAYALEQIKLADEFLEYTALGAYVHAKPIISLLSLMLRSWCKEADAFTLQDLISGLPKPSLLSEEARELWALAQMVHRSEPLSRLFAEHPGEAFFEAAAQAEQGRAFTQQYTRFVERHGHNGHSYRDIYFNRRVEDPSLDYESIQVLLKAHDAAPPDELEARLVRKREDTTARVLAAIRREPLGPLKATAFKLVHNWVMNFLLLRDDWRHSVNRVTLAKKRAFKELGLRAFERGLLPSERDFYFLSEQELYDVLDGKAPQPLVHAKVRSRAKVFDRFLAHEEAPPAFLKGSAPADLERPDTGGAAGGLQGVSISRGVARGKARVVADLKNIGKISRGDILVCNSTDPAWAPVFPLIAGLILETGGMLSHGACLSREYGLAAVQLCTAMQRIPDGAWVEVNGEMGQVRLLEGGELGVESSIEPVPAPVGS